jgi:hypothetical protein
MTRRFTMRFLVALLTFIIGLSAALLIGGVNLMPRVRTRYSYSEHRCRQPAPPQPPAPVAAPDAPVPPVAPR